MRIIFDNNIWISFLIGKRLAALPQFFRICNSEAVNISICNAELNDLRLPWYDSPTAQPL